VPGEGDDGAPLDEGLPEAPLLGEPLLELLLDEPLLDELLLELLLDELLLDELLLELLLELDGGGGVTEGVEGRLGVLALGQPVNDNTPTQTIKTRHHRCPANGRGILLGRRCIMAVLLPLLLAVVDRVLLDARLRTPGGGLPRPGNGLTRYRPTLFKGRSKPGPT